MSPLSRMLSCCLLLLALLSAAGAARAADSRSDAFRVVDAGNDTLVLIRPNATNDGTEALVVDARKLVDTLKNRVLEARGLGEVAELDPSDGQRGSFGSSAPSAESTPYVFSQTFAAPFDSLSATLRLRPLADPDDGALVPKLVAVIPICVVLGLFALYRMAAAQVRFAERRTNFVSAVSHELKTPLTAIRMHAEMLEEDLVSSGERRREYYRTITRESERLSRLIDNVLTFAQIERRTRKLETRVGDVTPVVRDGLELVRPQVLAQGFSLELEQPDPRNPLPSVRFEPDALKQVLFNLVENALKYGRYASDRRIVVSLEGSDQGVALSVRDHGPGVRREHLKAIFEPFFRGEHELTRKNQGTGIGLSLVRGLAAAMGASVRAENAKPGLRVQVMLVAR